MNSLTRICQAVTPGSRQGRSRPATSYQPSSSAALTVIALHHRSAAQICPGTGDEYGGIRRVTGKLLRRIRYYIAQQCFSATASIPIML